MTALAVLGAISPVSRTCLAETLLAETFDRLTGWRVVTIGSASIGVVESGPRGRYLRAESLGGMAFWSRDLRLDDVRGVQLTVRCMTQVERVSPGLQNWSAPKVHVAVETPAGVRHASSRLQQASSWRQTPLIVAVPEDALRVVLNVGIEHAPAVAGFDDLLVLSDRRDVHCVAIGEASNFAAAWLGADDVRADDVSFRFQAPIDDADGRHNCIVLRGAGRDEAPKQLDAPIPVGVVADSVYFLHATLGGKGRRETPSVIWTARFWDGQEASFSVFEGREIGSVSGAGDFENWRIVWRGVTAGGTPIVLGMTRWRLYATDVPLASLAPRAYSGSAPLIAAITVVSEPRSQAEEGSDDEGWQDGGWE